MYIYIYIHTHPRSQSTSAEMHSAVDAASAAFKTWSEVSCADTKCTEHNKQQTHAHTTNVKHMHTQTQMHVFTHTFEQVLHRLMGANTLMHTR